MIRDRFGGIPIIMSIELPPPLQEADPTSPARYFCSHAGGVHAVGLPMVTKLAEMASGGEAADATISCLQGGDCYIAA